MSKKLSTEEFIRKAKAVHGDKYDYSKVNYINNSTKVCIICPQHGEFWQTPNNHLKGKGCPKCGLMILHNKFAHTTEEFIEKAKAVHGDKYDYSKVNYINNHTKVCIICPQHGEFWQTPDGHINDKARCIKCGGKQKLSTEEFIEKAKAVHGDKYDYSKVNYINNSTKVCIICPQHGEFWQQPNHHLRGQGCPICIGRNKTQEEFIKKAKEIHGDKYDYSKVDYQGCLKKVCIICPIHGEFWQTPSSHINDKAGCIKCAHDYVASLKRTTKSKFIEKAKAVHGDKYDYSKVDYINDHTKVCIICPIHGEFWQNPNHHLRGQGCPKCKSSKLEHEIRMLLQENTIQFEEQKRFDWLRLQSLDFYLPQYNCAIECQGEQHYLIKDHFGGEDGFKAILERDIKKKKLLEENNIKLIYIVDNDINIDNLNKDLYNKENTFHINEINTIIEKIK